MIHKFLHAKHWQLFLLIFAIPLIFQTVVSSQMSIFIQKQLNHFNEPNGFTPDFSFMIGYLKFVPFIIIITMASFFGWLWSVGVGLQDKIPENINMKVSRLKIFLLLPLIYITVLSLLIYNFLSIGIESFLALTMNASILISIFLLHLFSIFCIGYCYYFVAKSIKTVELQREVTFSEFIGEFLYIAFFLIGVWMIQPRINTIFEEQELV